MDNIITGILVFAITGVLAVPFVVGMRDPKDYNRIAKIWAMIIFTIIIMSAAFDFGYQMGSNSKQEDETWSLHPLVLGVACVVYYVAMQVFAMIFVDPKLLEKPKDEIDKRDP